MPINQKIYCLGIAYQCGKNYKVSNNKPEVQYNEYVLGKEGEGLYQGGVFQKHWYVLLN